MMILTHSQENQRPHTLIVTGASSGIGRALALQLARDGHMVLAVGRDAVRLAALKQEYAGIEAVPFDLVRTAEISVFVSELVNRFPGIDGVINNAAIQFDRRIDDAGYTDTEIENEIATNLLAPIVLARSLLPHLQARSHAVICNVTTGLAFVPKRTAAVYSASKAGLHLFSEGLRVQLCGSRVRVVETVMPIVDTPMTAGRGLGKISADTAAQAIRLGLWKGTEKKFCRKSKFPAATDAVRAWRCCSHPST